MIRVMKARTSIPRVSAKAREYVNAVLDYGIHNTRTLGHDAKLESSFARRFGRRYGILNSNGTRTSIPRVSAKAREYVNAVLDYGIHNTRTLGHDAKLESSFARRFGRRYGILNSNGTTTMHSALLAADIGVGDEVIPRSRYT